MLWIFTRLNTLMTVAKEAADRVMEATMRAEMNITNNLGSTTNESLVVHPEHPKPVNPTDIVKRQDMHPIHQGHPMPLTTEGDRFVSVRRVHQKEVIPRPIKEEATPLRTLTGETVRVKKVEIQRPNIANPRLNENMSRDNDSCNPQYRKQKDGTELLSSDDKEKPIPSPTMPDLEDANTRWFAFRKTDIVEVFPSECTGTKMIPVQTFLRPGQNRSALPHATKLAKSDNNWPQTGTDIKQPERGKTQNDISTQQTATMGSHSKTPKPGGAYPDAISRLRQRSRLCQIAQRMCKEANNNQQRHPPPGQGATRQEQATPTTPTTQKRTTLSEYGRHQQTQNGGKERDSVGCAIDLSHLQSAAAIASPIHSILNWTPNPNTDPVDPGAGQQHQMANRDLQFPSSFRRMCDRVQRSEVCKGERKTSRPLVPKTGPVKGQKFRIWTRTT